MDAITEGQMAAFRRVRDPLDNLGWLSVGGDATLKSYGIDPVHALQPRRRGRCST